MWVYGCCNFGNSRWWWGTSFCWRHRCLFLIYSHGRLGRSGCMIGSTGRAGECLLYKWQSFTICLMSLEIPGQNTYFLARRMHLGLLYWPEWMVCKTSFRMSFGITIYYFFNYKITTAWRYYEFYFLVAKTIFYSLGCS